VAASSLATAAGTLVLAAATFSSVRSANRTARAAERSLAVGLRPVLFPSRDDDPEQKIRWGDNHWAKLQPGRASIEAIDGIHYLAMSLRNVGAGIAVLHGWRVQPVDRGTATTRPDPGSFRSQQRDLYIPASGCSFWQAAIREGDQAERDQLEKGLGDGMVLIDLLYGDHEGGQRVISRFNVVRPSSGGSDWLLSVVRHWNLDRDDPR